MDGSWFWVITIIPLIGTPFYLMGKLRFGNKEDALQDLEAHRESVIDTIEETDQVANVEIVWQRGE